MSNMDLDSLRGRWQDSGRRAEAALGFDAHAMRAALAARTHKAFRRHTGWLSAGLLVAGGTFALLAMFFLHHLGDWRYALMSGALLALVGAEFVVDLRQLLALRALDLDAPMLQVRATLDTLRARRLAMVKWVALSSLLLWWPALLVPFKAITGVDALRFIAPSVVWVNLALGVVAIPVGLWLSAWLVRRFGDAPGFRRFQLEAAGDTWKRAEDAFAAGEELESKLAAGTLDAESLAVDLPVSLLVPLRALRLRLDVGIALYALLIVATGVFNAMHGGQVAHIAAGVLVNLLWVSQLVGSILHRRAAMAPGASLAAWREGLASVARGRSRVLLSARLADVLALGALSLSREIGK